MVVKILSSAGTFSGVEYNENKVSIGSAQLLDAQNFGLLELDGTAAGRAVHEYQQFFKIWSVGERGSTINNPQFHAVISCEGREYNAEQLKAIAEQYLEKMGYKNNPYLIYFHSDTANNHVHIVSSRIGENQVKINDSFERRRSQTAIKEILGLDTGRQVSDEVKKALAYNFSSEAQFKILLEGKGIAVTEKNGHYQFIKGGGGGGYDLVRDQVHDKIKSYQPPSERISQLKALFAKYKPALAPDKFADFMKNKFGVEVVFHQAKGKDTPYGYTIIDHAKAQVLKGSQVMPLASLLSLASREDKLAAGAELITALSDDNKLRYRDFKSQLGKLGFELNASGRVKISGEEKASFTISQDRMNQVRYNDRLIEAQKFTVYSAAEAEIVGRVMGLKKHDFLLPVLEHQAPERELAKVMLADKLNSLLSIGKDLGDIAKENHYVFAKKGNAVFLIDEKNHALYNIASLTDSKPDYSTANLLDVDRASRPEHARELDQGSGTLREMAGLLFTILHDQPEEPKQDQRRIRKRYD